MFVLLLTAPYALQYNAHRSVIWSKYLVKFFSNILFKFHHLLADFCRWELRTEFRNIKMLIMKDLKWIDFSIMHFLYIVLLKWLYIILHSFTLKLMKNIHVNRKLDEKLSAYLSTVHISNMIFVSMRNAKPNSVVVQQFCLKSWLFWLCCHRDNDV